MAPAVAHFMNGLVEFAHTGPEFVSGRICCFEANLKLLLDESTDGASLQEAARQSRALLKHPAADQWYLEKQAGHGSTRAEAMFERDIQKLEDLCRIDEQGG